jgi:hypothetical protein
VSIEPMKVVEGTGGTRVLKVPFTIDGTVTRPSKFVAFTAGQVRGQTQRLVVDVAPGQTGGTIPVEYFADDLDGPNQPTSIALWPLRGIATDDYLATATVKDDDAAPAVHVEAVSPSVREGHPVKLRVTIDGGRSDTTYVVARAVRGDGEPLRGADVPTAWLSRHATSTDAGKPLYRLNAYLRGRLKPDDSELVLTIPTRKDGVKEGREFLDLELQVGDRRPVTRRVAVVDAD